MTTLTDMRDWLFRGIAVDDAIDRLEHEGLSVRPPTDIRASQRAIPLDGFPEQIRRNAMRAFPVQMAFFCFENSVRDLIRERMAETHGPNWWEEKAATKIRENVKLRQAKEGKQRWHSRRGDHPICYTDFGDLKKLIVTHFADFADLIPDQGWLHRFDDLEKSRNIIAHNNLLESVDIERIKLYLRDWLQQVSKLDEKELTDAKSRS